MMMITTVHVSPPISAFLASQGGFRGSTRGLQWRKIEKKCLRKAGPAKVTAKFDLKPPTYPLDALEPHMSRETLEYHWGKHHRTYVENLNKQIVGTELDGMTLEDIVLVTYNNGDLLPAFNNAAQVELERKELVAKHEAFFYIYLSEFSYFKAWNHEFFWESIQPRGGGEPSGELLELINRDFGSFEGFVKEFRAAALTQFGSGWAWLAYKANRLNVGNALNPCPSEEDKKLVVVKSPNAVNPLVWDYSPILTIDVWEHAYYLDFQNRRPDYISTFIEKLISWEAVSSRLDAAKARAAEREREEEKRKNEEEDQTASSEALEMYLESDRDDSESE